MQNPLWGTGNLEILIYHLCVQESPSRPNCFIYHHQMTPRLALSPGAQLALVPKAPRALQLPQQLVKAKNATKGPGSSDKKNFHRKTNRRPQPHLLQQLQRIFRQFSRPNLPSTASKGAVEGSLPTDRTEKARDMRTTPLSLSRPPLLVLVV